MNIRHNDFTPVYNTNCSNSDVEHIERANYILLKMEKITPITYINNVDYHQQKCSAGAILYTIVENKIYYILGSETPWGVKPQKFDIYAQKFNVNKFDYRSLFPFKGSIETYDKSLIETAIREIYEETLGLIKIDNINFDICFKSNKEKSYFIGFIEIDKSFVPNFNILRKDTEKMLTYSDNFKEKIGVVALPIECILENEKISRISRYPILQHYIKYSSLNIS